MNKRETPLAYLAGPIRSVRRDEALFWRRSIGIALHRVGIATFNPSAAWHVPNHHTNGSNDPVIEEHLQMVNDMTVMMCDIVIVGFQGVISRGTDHEIALARTLYKPLLVYHMQVGYLEQSFSMWYDAMFEGLTIPVYLQGEEELMALAARNIVENRLPPSNGYRPPKGQEQEA